MVQSGYKDKWSALHYNSGASFVYSQAYAAPLLNLLNAQPGEKIYDFGCGSGDLTVQVAEAVGPTGQVVGVDYSESMIAKAKKNGVKNAFVSDAQDVQFPEGFPEELKSGFDAIFSNAALHWCKRNPGGVLDSAKRILRPGGRYVIDTGGFMACTGVRIALYAVLKQRGIDAAKLDPWYYPSVDEYHDLLESKGFTVNEIGLHPYIVSLPDGLFEWLNLFLRQEVLGGFSDAEAKEILQEIEDTCAPDCKDERGRWSVMYVRLRVSATRN
ncbi:S-adenosyl-L-methionine-dependent methyltransferase [Cristinia sonorae]|uniref:S-adenosyl-L-methionine-dependent methyltransferase n=1 Tax=Cristinia sonorae TaxID=1940300 RepID=A0A8K0XK63_9AGAR|nr:S-adenosyl-L-methionine-dependent methyltransferase [Cristinia sonorae]